MVAGAGIRFDLPPAEAVRFFQGKGLSASFAWQDMLHDEHDRAFTVAKMMDLDLLADVRQVVDRALSEGWTQRRFIDELKPELVRRGWWGRAEMRDPATGEMRDVQLGSVRRLKTIYDANMRTAYAAGHWERIKENEKSAPYVMYSAVLDGRTRQLHREWSGKVLRADDPWWETNTPPNGWNCFPGDVPLRCDAQLGLRTWYSGEMVELHTRLGHALTVTANHPVLTTRGWLPAHLIHKGDELIGATSDVNAPLRGVVDHAQAPTRAKDLFEALAAQGLRVAPMAPDDFHGDAGLRKAEIDIAGSDRALVDVIEATLGQFASQIRLDAADGRRVEPADDAARAALAVTLPADAVLSQNSTDCRMGNTEPPSDVTLRGKVRSVHGQRAPLDFLVPGVSGMPRRSEETAGLPACLYPDPALPHCLAAVTHGDAALEQDASESTAAAAERRGELLQANAGLIALDEVAFIRKFDWAGHVYDFVTSTGLILAGGVVAHNCRCTVIQLSQRDLEKLGKSGPDKAPHSPTREWTNPRTGEVMQLPAGVDPGWGYAPGASRRADVLGVAAGKAEQAPADLGTQFVASLVQAQLPAWLAAPEGAFPVMRINDGTAAAIGAEQRVVLLSADSAKKNLINHPDLEADDYVRLPQLGEAPDLVVQDSARSVVLIKRVGSLYYVAVKSTETGKANFLTSYRRTNKADVRALVKRGKVIEGGWDD